MSPTEKKESPLKPHGMGLTQWIVSTAIAGVSMAIGMGSYVRATVYSRDEGQAVEQKVKDVASHQALSDQQQREDLTHMRDKIDDIYELLIDPNQRAIKRK
jgi:hypothetical protein